ncbi:hypothetical protein INR49_030624, partial [Caranx melampygus]
MTANDKMVVGGVSLPSHPGTAPPTVDSDLISGALCTSDHASDPVLEGWTPDVVSPRMRINTLRPSPGGRPLSARPRYDYA